MHIPRLSPLRVLLHLFTFYLMVTLIPGASACLIVRGRFHTQRQVPYLSLYMIDNGKHVCFWERSLGWGALRLPHTHPLTCDHGSSYSGTITNYNNIAFSAFLGHAGREMRFPLGAMEKTIGGVGGKRETRLWAAEYGCSEQEVRDLVAWINS